MICRNVQKKNKLPQELGFIVHEMWYCDYKLYHASNDLKVVEESLRIRDAYFGGRTNSINLKEEFSEEKLKGGYVDFCSLYLHVLKYENYPLHHPIHINGNFTSPISSFACDTKPCPILGTEDCNGMHLKLNYFGLIKAKLLPLCGLLLPDLPIKINNKLMFPLCHTCAMNESQQACNCPHKDRVLIHTWCTPEINLALNMGYILIKIYEVLNWSENTFNEQRLFSNYINMLLKMKTQASGYPSNVTTHEQKNKYIRQYKKHEGVHLDPNKIENNPSLLSIQKLALNSFHGKFGQRTDMKKVQFINQYEKLYSILMDVTKVIKSFHILNNDMITMEYKQSEEFEELSNKTNVIISAFCSAYTHVKLWKMMNRLGNRVLYHDRDSIIYTYKSQEWIPPTGEYLGDLMDELSCSKKVEKDVNEVT